jgi:hypothetical protein
MATSTSNSNLKQIKASPADKINGKVKIQNKADGNAALPPANGFAKATGEHQTTALSPDQRRRVSGRGPPTTEEQRMILRKRVSMSLSVR